MPLTFAHPAAAIPLARPLGRWGVGSALIIGSIVPDLFYILPLTLPRASSHSPAGLAWFCLPVGIALYALFHAVLKRPLCSLLPASWQRRIESGGSATRAGRIAVGVSLMVGALTHVAWDAFTHLDGPGVVALPALNRLITTFSGYDLYLYRLLQHASTLLGVSLLGAWTAGWARRAAPAGVGDPWRPVLTPRARVLVVATLVAGATVIAVVAAAEWIPAEMSLGALQPFVGRVAQCGLQSLVCGMLLYAAAWHGRRRLTLVRRGR